MLNDAELALVAREVKMRSGAVLTRDMGGPIAVRLQPLARREGFASVSELIGAARIRADGALWNAIADNLAQSDTRFFRDRSQFEKLRTRLIPDAAARRGHERVRIWSAGCATGQEPYSLAMIADELRKDGLNTAIEIVATDLSERLLEKARAGLYTQFEIQRGLPIRKLIAYFEKAGDLWRICDRLRASVRFENFNLMKHPGTLGQFDIVLLAHVLSSFDHETRLAVLARLADALSPEGVLLLGAGETLPEGCETFTLENGLARKPESRRVAAA
jgi:chemotaxis protein methyltransferase CheR